MILRICSIFFSMGKHFWTGPRGSVQTRGNSRGRGPRSEGTLTPKPPSHPRPRACCGPHPRRPSLGWAGGPRSCGFAARKAGGKGKCCPHRPWAGTQLPRGGRWPRGGGQSSGLKTCILAGGRRYPRGRLGGPRSEGSLTAVLQGL